MALSKHLIITLEPLSSEPASSSPRSKPSVSLRVKIKNTSTTTTITFLTWSSPIDPSAPKEGLFKFTSRRNGSVAPSLGLKKQRAWPPTTGDDFIELKPGEEIEREVKIGEPAVDLEAGEIYTVVAEGRWLGLWGCAKADQQAGPLAMKGEGGEMGEWRSEEIIVQT